MGKIIILALLLISNMNIKHTYNYSQSDVDRIKNIIVEIDKPTEIDFIKYDLDGDRTISLKDMVSVKKIAIGRNEL